MPSNDARGILQEENKLLDKLAEHALASAQLSSGVTAQIKAGWAGSFLAYKGRNDTLIAADDEDFDKYLREERLLLEVLAKAIDGYNGEVANSWRAMFAEELEILAKLG